MQEESNGAVLVSECDRQVLLELLSFGGESVQRYYLEPGVYTIGALPECDIVVNSGAVSRRHARLALGPEGAVRVEDLGSKNGTFVNESRVLPESAVDCKLPLAIQFGPLRGTLATVKGAGSTRKLPLRSERPGGAAVHECLRGSSSTSEYLVSNILADELLGALRRVLDAGACVPFDIAPVLATLTEVLDAGSVKLSLRGQGEVGMLTAVAVKRRTPPHSADRQDMVFDQLEPYRLTVQAASSQVLKHLLPLIKVVYGMAVLGLGRVGVAGYVSDGSRGRDTDRHAIRTDVLHSSDVMRNLMVVARQFAEGDVPILILGESGVGKELLARWIHARSARADDGFFPLNCAAVPRDLLEAELFGIEPGVATGVAGRPGLFESAGAGTILLDEIADMALDTQARVLRALDAGEIYRVGGRQPIRVKARILAATNRDIREMVRDGAFRRDLFYRIAGCRVVIPPLRERREDIPLLATHFMQVAGAARGRSCPGITERALTCLVQFDWPGNVRQLKNEIGSALLLLAPGEALDSFALGQELQSVPESRDLTLAAAISRARHEAYRVALAAAAGDLTLAAELLGVSRATLYRDVMALRVRDDLMTEMK